MGIRLRSKQRESSALAAAALLAALGLAMQRLAAGRAFADLVIAAFDAEDFAVDQAVGDLGARGLVELGMTSNSSMESTTASYLSEPTGIKRVYLGSSQTLLTLTGLAMAHTP